MKQHELDEIKRHLDGLDKPAVSVEKSENDKPAQVKRTVKRIVHKKIEPHPKPAEALQDDSTPTSVQLTKAQEQESARVQDGNEKGSSSVEIVHDVEVLDYVHTSPQASARPTVRRKGKRKFPLSFAAGVLLILVFFLGFANALAAISSEGIISTPGSVIRDRTQTVSGIVRSNDGQPIEGAQVTVIEGAMSDATDMEGWYVIKGISLGNHKVKAELPGYKAVTKEIDLTSAFPRTVDFVLEPGDGADYVPLEEKSSTESLHGQIATSAGIMMLFSFFGIAGAALALMKRFYPIAIAFAGLSTLSIGFIFGSVLALCALVLIFMARPEFPMDRRKVENNDNMDDKEASRKFAVQPGKNENPARLHETIESVALHSQEKEAALQTVIKDEGIPRHKETDDGLSTVGSCNICTQDVLASDKEVFKCKCGSVLHKACLKRVGICPDCKRRYAQRKEIALMKAGEKR